LRADVETLEQFFCQLTAKKLIDAIIIKKPIWYSKNALHRNARNLSMPLSALYSRINDKKQLRTNVETLKQFFCQLTAKKLIDTIIIKKPIWYSKNALYRNARYLSMQLSALYSRINDKQQLRTNVETLEQFFCQLTAKKLIDAIIIKKPIWYSKNALHRNARYLSMPLSDFYSRRNDKKQLRTDVETLEQFLCRPTARMDNRC